MSIESVIHFNHLVLCRSLLLLLSIFPSTRIFSNESALHIRWPKYWSFSFSISASNEYPGLISFQESFFPLITLFLYVGIPLYSYEFFFHILQLSTFVLFWNDKSVSFLSLVLGWPKSFFGFYIKIRHIFHFYQELYWTTYSPFCFTTFCHFSCNFSFPCSQNS